MEYEAFLDSLLAAERVETDETCEFDTDEWGDCENTAEWLIEYGTPPHMDGESYGMLVCQRCSSRGWIYACENELCFNPVSEDILEEFDDRFGRVLPLEEYVDEDSLEWYDRHFSDTPANYAGVGDRGGEVGR